LVDFYSQALKRLNECHNSVCSELTAVMDGYHGIHTHVQCWWCNL